MNYSPTSLQRTASRVAAGLCAVGAFVAVTASSPVFGAINDSTTWNFDLPATGAQNPPYPSVAALVLTETADGVQFTLTPTWNDPPAGRFGVGSQIERLDIVIDNTGYAALLDFAPTYPGTLFNSSFRWDAGAPVKSFDFDTNVNMDTGYQADNQHIVIDFFSKNNDPDANRFDTTFASSTWTVFGRNLLDFTETHANANAKPSPAQGIISVTAYSLEDPKPTPSNWVAGPGPTSPQFDLPEPGTLLLVGLGLAGFAATRRLMLR